MGRLQFAVVLAVLLAGSRGILSAEPVTPEVGRFLVATHQLEDPNFRRTVILLVAADETGALGLIVNRPARGQLPPGGSSEQASVYSGGPVPAGLPFILFRSDSAVTEAGHVVDDVYVTVSEAVLADLAREGLGDDRVRVYVGYAGWGPGQLEAEIGRGDWTLREASGADVFSSAPLDLWRRLAPPPPPLSARVDTRPRWQRSAGARARGPRSDQAAGQPVEESEVMGQVGQRHAQNVQGEDRGCEHDDALGNEAGASRSVVPGESGDHVSERNQG